MTIREFRDQYQPQMDDIVLYSGEFLEHNGLIFGQDFVVADAIDLAAAFLTRKWSENFRDEQLEKKTARLANRFQDEDWEERYA